MFGVHLRQNDPQGKTDEEREKQDQNTDRHWARVMRVT